MRYPRVYMQRPYICRASQIILPFFEIFKVFRVTEIIIKKIFVLSSNELNIEIRIEDMCPLQFLLAILPLSSAENTIYSKPRKGFYKLGWTK